MRIVHDEKLESIIHENPAAEASWQVYADALLAAGDPRGEIITTGITGGGAQEMERLVEIYEDVLWGEDAIAVRDGVAFEDVTWTGGWEGATPQPIEVSIDYELNRYGMIDTLHVQGLDDEGHVAKALHTLLLAPVARFVRLIKLEVGETYSGTSGQPNYDMVAGAIARASPRSLRCLELRASGYQVSWTDTGNLGPLLAVANYLEEIDIYHGRIFFGSKPLDLPRLRRLRLESGGIPAETIEVIGTSMWPELERMELFLGTKDYGGDTEEKHLAGLLERPEAFPSLRHLALCNSDIQPAILHAMVKSPLLRQLKTLDLSKGILGDDDIKPFLEKTSAFKHLERIDLSESYLSPQIIDTLETILPNRIHAGEQRYEEMLSAKAQYGTPDWDTTGFRYVSLGE